MNTGTGFGHDTRALNTTSDLWQRENQLSALSDNQKAAYNSLLDRLVGCNGHDCVITYN